MKRAAIIGSKNGELCRELTASLEKRNCQVSFVDARDLSERAGYGTAKAFSECDAAVIRGIPAGTLEEVIFRMDALYIEESRGLPLLNSPKCIEKTVDKYLTTALLEMQGLPVPPTVCLQPDRGLLQAYTDLGQDVIYKPLFGSCGHGMVRITSEEEAVRLAHTLEEEERVAYLQKFIPCAGSDIRAFVLGGQVIASMRRTGTDWRANLSLGGKAEKWTLSSTDEELALKAASAVGAEVAGVDLIHGEDGSVYILEVNGCPGWKGLSEVTGTDVAAEIADYLLKMMR